MWNWKKVLIPMTLAVTLAVPTIAFAVNKTTLVDANPNAAADIKPKLTLEERLEQFRERQENRQERMEKIIEKYAPETLPQWKAAMAERKQVKEELITLAKEKGIDIKADVQAKRDELKAKVQAGEITKEEAKEQMQAFRAEMWNKLKDWKADKKEDLAPFIKENKELRAQLKAAIQSGDETTIDTTLNKIFEVYKERTQLLANKVAELKK